MNFLQGEWVVKRRNYAATLNNRGSTNQKEVISTPFFIYKNGADYFVHQTNSDGAAYYEIVWVLNEKGLKQRLVGSWF